MYHKILHATDLGGNHYKMCEQAAEIAKIFNAKLHLIFVIEPPASLQLAQGLGFAEFDRPIKTDADEVMKLLGDAINVPEKCQYIEIGSVKHQIINKAKELGCDLIIVGSHTPSNLPAFLGSTAHAVVNHASCDVLTLRA